MSKYTDYQQASQNYDSFRYAASVEMMTGILAGILKKNPGEISLLEAGCGTGNYSIGFLESGIGKLTMFDACDGMIELAREKVLPSDRVSEIKKHELPSIPYGDETFDVVTFIHVLHHLDVHHLSLDPNQLMASSGPDGQMGDAGQGAVSRMENYPNLVRAIHEAHRVLKPGGVILIDHCFRQNIERSWIALAPKALSIWKEATVSEDCLLQVLKAEKFENMFYMTCPGRSLLTRTMYDDPELIFNEAWRNSSSEWNFVERTGELNDMIELIKKKKDEGKLCEFVNDRNTLFQGVGEATMLYGQKL